MLVLGLLVTMSACGPKGAGSSGYGSTINGQVAAPGGGMAFNPPTGLKKWIYKLWNKDAIAANPGVYSVGSGVTVNLIEIDNNGNQIGRVLASTTTDGNGNYTLLPPGGFNPASRYIVQAVGSAASMNSFVTSTNVTVDPYSHTTQTMIMNNVSTSGANINNIGLNDITTIQQDIISHGTDISTTALTVSGLVSALQAAVQNDNESSKLVTSIGKSGIISGTVLDSSGNPIPNILITVRTYGDQTTTALTRTTSNGSYLVHVPTGEYIVGAINDTSSTTVASQWWSSSGGAISQFSASKITSDGTTPVANKNFTLAAGGRIKGVVTSNTTGEALAGINVALCDFSSGQTLMTVRTQNDGSYNLNVPAGNYYLSFRNSTLAPYATGVYSSSVTGGGSNKCQADKLTVTAGQTITANMALLPGKMISGLITTDSTRSVAAPGVVVRLQDSTSSFAESLRTNVDGTYRIWVQPGTYNIYARGQKVSSLSVSSSNVTQNFAADTGYITATVKDASGNPIGQATAYLYDTSAANQYSMLGYEITNADGTVTLYGTPGQTAYLVVTVTNGQAVGSTVYSGKTYYVGNGNQVTIPAAGQTTALNTVTMLSGAVVNGVVTKSGVRASNKIVQVRIGAGTGGTYRLANVRTMSDGSYSISLPSGQTINRICAYDNDTTCAATAGTYGVVDNTAALTAGSTNTINIAY